MRILLTFLTGYFLCALQPWAGEIMPVKPVFGDFVLLPEGKGIRMDVAGAKVEGRIESIDKDRVCSLVGRVKGIYPKIHRLRACFDEHTVAVAVSAGEREVYCTRDSSGNWEVIRAVKWVAGAPAAGSK